MYSQPKNLSTALKNMLTNALTAFMYVFLFIASVWISLANAKDDKKIYHLSIKHHIFTPTTLTIPANEKVKIIIENHDDVAEEFESFDLNREKVIFAGRKSTIYVGPLPEGTYEYFGEFHPNTARGKIIVVEMKP
ncbi:cupredoxin domain-containing protein [Pseudocolwellia sp. AS88]|jgi:heme/copper-type cytochrome/quinol oxidase subunit 2|uniref:cupredoxin domain-containing protein n=1 Tax=Pseudocolwellia sp. AS88 TaxID=3063958 RepID=UPI0026EEBAF5|nr:cupredoxin domain-containing protein [Pseudocolwellia sp. AS88]MDO7086542.1 cupredoxin domain-containing protein [Pseudocolwellia sp. AS88]